MGSPLDPAELLASAVLSWLPSQADRTRECNVSMGGFRVEESGLGPLGRPPYTPNLPRV